MTDSGALPPGQHVEPLERFGLPAFARRQVRPPARPTLTITGHVERPQQVDLIDLLTALPRHDQPAPLHCVTTWSATGHVWSGPRFADLLARLDELVGPHPRARWLLLVGLDGYQHPLRRDDARAPAVVLADRLDHQPLSFAHGAPARLVVPDRYGYTWVKHLARIEYHQRRPAGSARALAHPRGRVWPEERSRLLPGWLWRQLWGRLLRRARRPYRS